MWHVESAHRKLLADLAVAEAGARIEAAGIAAVGEDEWRANQTAWKTIDDLGLDPEAHRGESCHAVVVKADCDGTVVEIPACTEPRRHRGRKPDSELVVTPSEPSEADQTATVDRRERRHATQSRTEWVSERLRTGRPPAIADAFPLAIATWIDSAPYTAAQKAATLLGIEPVERRNSQDLWMGFVR